MSTFEAVLAQALQLPDEQRGELVARLLRSLEPEEGDEITGEEWEATWSDEVSRRIHEVEDGSAELIDGDEVLREARARYESRRG